MQGAKHGQSQWRCTEQPDTSHSSAAGRPAHNVKGSQFHKARKVSRGSQGANWTIHNQKVAHGVELAAGMPNNVLATSFARPRTNQALGKQRNHARMNFANRLPKNRLPIQMPLTQGSQDGIGSLHSSVHFRTTNNTTTRLPQLQHLPDSLSSPDKRVRTQHELLRQKHNNTYSPAAVRPKTINTLQNLENSYQDCSNDNSRPRRLERGGEQHSSSTKRAGDASVQLPRLAHTKHSSK